MLKLLKVCCPVIRPVCLLRSSKTVWVATVTASLLNHLAHPVYYGFTSFCLVLASPGMDGKNTVMQVSTWLTKQVATQGDPFRISRAGATLFDHTIHRCPEWPASHQ